ncbi:MFS transporter [Occultella glacieicola]|nr:MFS transporter [Occultella glacieicola]
MTTDPAPTRSGRRSAAEVLRGRPGLLLAAALVLVGINLRAPITSLAAVLPDIRSDLGLDPTTAGLLTSLPVVCFAVGAPLIAAAVRRFGVDRVIVFGLLVIATLTLIRPWGPAWALLAGTAVIGLAITSGNVLLPVVVRRDFPAHQGPMTAISTSSVTGGAAIAAAVTVPLALWLGWQPALAAWAALALVAALVWARLPHPAEPAPPAGQPPHRPWSMPSAWVLAIYFGTQSGLFYGMTAWLPSMLPELAGTDAATAGAAASAFQLVGILGTLTAPVLLARVRARRVLIAVILSAWLIGIGGMLAAPGAFWVWCVVTGYAQGSSFAMAMTLVTLRSTSVAQVRGVSAMTQTVGYGLAALAPVAVGALYAATGTWTASMGLLLGIGVVVFLSGTLAGSHKPLS